jgi:hypothetical protein
MKKRVWIYICAVSVIALTLAIFLPPTHARQDKSVGQGWKIVPHVKSDDLEDALKKLNAAGFTVPKDAIHKDDEGFVIILNGDDAAHDEDDDEGRR